MHDPFGSLNAQFLGLRTSGVGTGENGLPISGHQLGFVPPAQEIIVRKAGEQTTGYAESAYGIINRYQFGEGRLKGLVAGLSTIYQKNFRAYRYTDVADGSKRKTFYYLQETGVTLDAIRPAPYDDGGCGCAQRQPWLRTFLGLAGEISALGRAHWPAMETFISGW